MLTGGEADVLFLEALSKASKVTYNSGAGRLGQEH